MKPLHPTAPFAPRALRRLRGAAALCAVATLLAACAVPVQRTTRIDGAAPPLAEAPAVDDARYGSVRRIEVIDTHAQPGAGGAVLGGLVGGVLGNQIGHGMGRAAATVLGAFGGAAIGNEVESQQAAAVSGRVYEVVVRFDDGRSARYDYRALNGLRVGDRVRLQDGRLGRA